jgi:2-polyprenyl-3-methyl-5-hydroxy-6-metoxy-1,4-benzoquinol methylase
VSLVKGLMETPDPRRLETAQRQLRDTAELLGSVEWTGKSVLDVGCWWGWFIRYAREKGARVFGFDREASQLKDAVEYLRSGNNLCLADAVHMPFSSGIFDVVVSMHVLEHVESEKGMMDEIRRVLKPDGVLLISVPNDLSFGVLPYRPFRLLLRGKMAAMLSLRLQRYFKSLSYGDLSHHREYTARSIGGLLQSNGFEVERVWHHGLDLPYPLKGRLSQKTRQRISLSFGHMIPGVIRSSISLRAIKQQRKTD